MIFKQVKVGPMQNFSYIIGDEKTKEAAVVDAGWDVDKLINICEKENLRITKIVLTHSHYDHTQKVDELASKTNSAVYFHEDDYNEIKRVIKNPSIKIHKLKNNDEIKVGTSINRKAIFDGDQKSKIFDEIQIKIIHTPGHTPGAICLLVENKLLTGDTLFVNAIGRTDLAGGDSIKLFESLQKLKKLNDIIEIYPGHDYGEIPFSTIGGEKKTNPYFMCNTKEQFLNLVGLF